MSDLIRGGNAQWMIDPDTGQPAGLAGPDGKLVRVAGGAGTRAAKVFDAARHAPSFALGQLRPWPYLDVTRLGVSKTSGADQDAAIAAAIASCTAAGCAAYFPAGTYRHAAAIVWTCPVIGDGPLDTVFLGTNVTATPLGAMHFDAVSGLFAYGVGKQHLAGPARSASTLAGGIVFSDADDCWAAECRVDATAATGLYLSGAVRCAFSAIEVIDTLADGFHIRPSVARGSQAVMVDRYTARRCGDDFFAVVSYTTDTFRSAGIFASNLDLADQLTAGRGITVLGGADVTIDGFKVARPINAGVYIGADSGNPTQGSARVTLRNGRLDECGSSVSGQGSLHFRFVTLQPSSGIAIEDVRIQGSRSRALNCAGDADPAACAGLEMARVRSVDNQSDAMQFQGITGLTLSDCEIHQSKQSGVVVLAANDQVSIDRLRLRQLNTVAGASHDAVRFAAAGAARTCTLGQVELDNQPTVLDRLVEIGANWTPTLAAGTRRRARVKSGVAASIAGYTDAGYVKETY